MVVSLYAGQKCRWPPSTSYGVNEIAMEIRLWQDSDGLPKRLFLNNIADCEKDRNTSLLGKGDTAAAASGRGDDVQTEYAATRAVRCLRLTHSSTYSGSILWDGSSGPYAMALR